MIRVEVKRESGIEFAFDIDINFRTAILGENSIGKSSILEAIHNKNSGKIWFSVEVPKNIKTIYFSQIEKTEKKISGGEHTKERLEKLFVEKADLYIMDEPTNNLDKDSILWLKNKITKDNIKILFTSHDISFIDEIAEAIFYLDSKGVEKTKEKCSEYLVSRKTRVEQAFVEYEVDSKKYRNLIKSSNNLKEKAKLGEKWENEDKSLQGFKRERAGKGSSAAKNIKERAEEMKPEEPKYDQIPRVKLEAETSKKHYLEIGLNSINGKRVSFSMKNGDKIVFVGPNGSGKTTLINKIIQYIKGEKLDGEDYLKKSENFNYVYISQNWYENINETTASEYMNNFGLSEQDKYIAFSYNNIDIKNLSRKITDISPGTRIKILLGILSVKKYDLIIWDEPTNHLDVMTQIVLKEAFIKYDGMLLFVTHDKNLIKEDSFVKVDFCTHVFYSAPWTQLII
ncbi:MAG: ATP-binding cassette domain-containing protein [Candidatus Paceibacterota bacterium]|jgi:ATPase subunit of ABC transporter with duplicated ATPase domains